MTPKVVATADTWVESEVLAAWRERAARSGHRAPPASFEGRRVLTLESRRAPELALLILNYGGRPVVAPSLREVPLSSNHDALAFAQALVHGQYALVVLMTGVGTRLLVQLAEPVHGREAFVVALTQTRIVARGPKPFTALRELGITPWLTVQAPNTWREVIAELDVRAPGVCAGTRIAVQEYGIANPELVNALQTRGALVSTVPIYRWALPADVRPLRAAVQAILDGAIDVLLLTAGVQITHLLQIATTMGLEPRVREALGSVAIASIGPMTSEELRRHGLSIDLEATKPKMGFLVKEVAECCGDLLRNKQRVLP